MGTENGFYEASYEELEIIEYLVENSVVPSSELDYLLAWTENQDCYRRWTAGEIIGWLQTLPGKLRVPQGKLRVPQSVAQFQRGVVSKGTPSPAASPHPQRPPSSGEDQ